MSARTSIYGLACMVALAAVPMNVGCSGADAVETEEDESDLKASSVLGDVGAIRIHQSPQNITGERLQTILENLGLQKGAKKPKTGALRCPPKVQYDLFKPNGEALGSVELQCDADQTTNVPGTLKVGGKSYLITAKDVDDIRILAYDGTRVGDVFFAADRATIGRPGAGGVEVSGAKFSKFLATLKVDEKPNYAVTGNGMRCPPARLITVYKGSAALGSIALNCSEQERGWVTAIMTPAAGNVGYPAVPAGVSVNAGAIFTLEKSLQ